MLSGLRWSDRKRLQLIKAIQTKRSSVRSGASCIFVPITKTVGVKLYCKEKVRDKAFLLQRHASKHRLAPLVGDCFSLQCLCIQHDTDMDDEPEVRANVVYGYLTQRARVPGRLAQYRCNLLCNRLADAGIWHTDLWSGNVGYIRNRLVCIDFDFWSCRWKAGRKGGKDAKRP